MTAPKGAFPKFDRDHFKVEFLRLADLSPHPKIQRAFIQAWGDALAKDFDPDKFLPLLVVPDPRRPGRYLVFGGQHRCYAASIALGADQRVPCHVYEDVPIERLACIARGVDHGRSWRAIEDWSRRVAAKDEDVLKIEAIVHRAGLRIDKTRGAGVVQAVAALETVLTKRGGEPVLDRALRLLKAAYGGDADAFDKPLILGAARLFLLLDGKIDSDELAHKLATHSGPARMIGHARDYAKTSGCAVERAMAEKMLQVFNKGRRAGGRLSLPA